MAFEFWQQFNKELKIQNKHSIDLRMLSPQHKHSIIPYMSERLDNQLLCETIAKITEYAVYNDSENCHIENNFVVFDDTAFFINPLNQQNIQAAYERSNSDKMPKFTKIGIIGANHSVFKGKNNKVLEITSEHSSLKFFKKIMLLAINQNASDLHIAPRNKTHIYFRFRIDGVLVDNLIDDIELEGFQLLANQIISHANCEAGNYINIIASKFNIIELGIDATIRVSMMTTEFLFKNNNSVPRFVLRIHDNTKDKIKDLSSIGLNDDLLSRIMSITNLNQGLIIVTGPTGSGKTTLLYALLNAINNTQRGKSIQTLEDPVEQNLPNIDQCSINAAAGTDYETGLMAFLRQDIDVALIGEIRDKITAAKITEIAMTGHLALSTLHTNTALGTINRLRRLLVDDRDIADTLKVVIATRLVRAVCQACAKSIKKTDKSFENYQGIFKNLDQKTKFNLLTAGDGCEKCGFSTYSGRHLVAEIHKIDTKACAMIVAQKSTIEIQQYIVQQNNKTIWTHGAELLASGKTTISELQFVLPPFGSDT